MNGQSRSEFEAELRQLGYGELESFDYDPCTHGATDGCAIFVMPTTEDRDAATYGELGWLVYEGCKPCCMACAQVLFCGGMFTHLRVFVGGVQTERSGAAEIRPAGEPIDHGAPEDDLESAEDED
jgi:hypothetical protein